MGRIVRIAGRGEAYLPTRWMEAVGEGESLKSFSAEAKGSLNPLLKHIRLGGSAVVFGSWNDMTRLLAILQERRKELLGYTGGRQVEREKERDFWEEAYRQVLARLLVTASAEGLLDTVPPLRIPHLLEFLGDHRQASQGLPLVVPVMVVKDLLAALDQLYPVFGLEAELVAPESVLQPRQQEVYDLFREVLPSLREQLPSRPLALDMGCGCGVLTLLMARSLGGLEARIWATDILPEALATTQLNVERFVSLGHIVEGVVQVTEGGDLYAPVGDERFDIIIFNPPWANAPARTRLEVARYDYQQRTVRRFLQETPAHLRDRGHVLLFYADNAGEKVIEALREHIIRVGLSVSRTLSRRIRVARKWENIYLYDLVARSVA